MIHELNLSTQENIDSASNTLMRFLVSQEFFA